MKPNAARVAPGVLLGIVALLACPAETKPPPPPPPPVVETKPAPPPAPPPAVTDITAENFPMPRLPRGKVTLNKKHVIDVEIAASRDARTRGLMWRYALPEGTGMLFIFNREQPLSFWMRNTLISLDIIFIDSKGKVVSIAENAEPRTLTSRPSTGPATYVLEMPGGWSAKSGVKAGSTATFEGISTIVADD